MKITDYATGRTVENVQLDLSAEEAWDLATYLRRLLNGDNKQAYLSDVKGVRLERDFAVQIDEAPCEESQLNVHVWGQRPKLVNR